MSNFNRFIGMGNLVRDPELRDIGDKKVANFTIAINDPFAKDNKAFFLDCSAWNGLGENLAKYKKKGESILVEGRLQSEEWVDKETNQPKSKVKLVTTSITFTGKSENSNTETERPSNAPTTTHRNSDFD
jgi:single-strand DNA-binding protein